MFSYRVTLETGSFVIQASNRAEVHRRIRAKIINIRAIEVHT